MKKKPQQIKPYLFNPANCAKYSRVNSRNTPSTPYTPGSHTNLNTEKPLITNTSEEFIKCRLDNFSMSFILYYVNFSICENK